MFKLTYITKNEGFSITAVLVSTALIGMLSIGVLQLVGTSLDSQKSVEQIQARMFIESEAQLYLSDSTACKNTFRGLLVQGAGTTVASIKDSGNNPKFEAATNKNYQGIRINSIHIGSYVASSRPGFGISQVSIQVSRNGSKVGGALQAITFPILTEVNAANRVIDCYALGEFRSLWKLGTAGNIYYDAGDVAIGRTSPDATLDVNGDSITRGTQFANEFIYTSDARLKQDVTPLKGALETIRKLNGVHFTWKSTGQEDIGLIAQEVEPIVPELIGQIPGSDYKAVKYGNIVALLIEATKEQQEEISLLKKEMRQLKSYQQSQLHRKKK